MKSRSLISHNRFAGAISTSSLRNFLPMKQKLNVLRIKHEPGSENIPPPDTNIQKSEGTVPSEIDKQSRLDLPKSEKDDDIIAIGKGGLLRADYVADPHVKVFVRIRPSRDHEEVFDSVRKISPDSLIVEERTFSFDSVLHSSTLQEDVFKLVGVPLVKNSLAGFNTSIVSYGQMGSGKSYTMWGPPNSMVDGHCNDQKGIVPRMVEMLFSEIQKERVSFEGKHVTYQCRCSFLEVYNDQIVDLIDPAQRNLKIMDDSKNGFYVENLTEDYVSDMENAINLLIKGLSNRKLGGTGLNSKSSRSHVIFTCIVESWRKGNYSSNGISGSKTSRICFVDLSGAEKNFSSDSKIVNEGQERSLTQLGRVVNLLSERTGSAKQEGIPYEDSLLTHLLRDSFGGNAKLSVICTVPANQRCIEETLNTLRFGERVRCILNEPVINEITVDDVNDLSDQIRQLKEELINAKTGSITSSRETLNQLRISLNHSLRLPCIHTDSEDEEEEEVGMEDVKQLQLQINADLLPHPSPFHLSSFESCNTHLTTTTAPSTSIDDLTVPPSSSPSSSSSSLLPTDSVAASIQKGVRIISQSFSFDSPPLCPACASAKLLHQEDKIEREKELKAVCQEQAARIEQLQLLLLRKQNREEYGGVSAPQNSTEVKPQQLLPWKNLDEESEEPVTESREGEEEEREEKAGGRWAERESDWICLTEDLRVDLQRHRNKAERLEAELRQEKASTEELGDALQRSVSGTSRMVEHYTELQEKYNDLGERYRGVTAGIAEMKRAAERVRGGGRGIARALVEEMTAIRLGKERERNRLRTENRRLRAQVGDTADALRAAGDLLSRLREAEDAVSVSQEKERKLEEEKEKMKRQLEDEKKRHKTEMVTMKRYLAQSRLPESALKPFYQEDDYGDKSMPSSDNQPWRAEFEPLFQHQLRELS